MIDRPSLSRRLKSARLQRGLSQSDVATRLDVPRSAVSMMESGQRSVSSDELLKLSQLFQMPVDLLLQTETDGGLVQRFRAEGALAPDAAPPALQELIDSALTFFEMYAELESVVYGGQRYSVPSYPLPPARAVDQAAHLAVQERRRLGLTSNPVPSVIELLEREGVKVSFRDFPADSHVSGCYFFSNQLGPCVLLNKTEKLTRQRFTAAHEYAHFLTDRVLSGSSVCDVRRRDEVGEMRANAFAANFLLPPLGIEAALREVGGERGQLRPDHAVHIMSEFGVSYDAALWRLLNLGWIAPAQRQQLAAANVQGILKMIGQGRIAAGGQQEPVRLRQIAVEAWRLGAVSIERLSEILETPVSTLARSLGEQNPQGRRLTTPQSAQPDWF